MRIFIDSANIEEIKEINEMGFLEGVTTNPSLVAKEKRDYFRNDGLTLLRDIVTIFNQFAFPAEVIAASIRHPLHAVESARIGAHIATIPYPVIK